MQSTDFMFFAKNKRITQVKSTPNYRLWFLFIFLLQLIFLPGRYYVALNDYFWPFTYTLIILSGFVLFLFVSHFVKFAVNVRDTKHRNYIFPIFLCILLLLTVQLISLCFNIHNSLREPIDILIYFISFYGPMIMLFIVYSSINSFNDVVKLIRIYIFVAFLAISVSVIFSISETLWGFVHAPPDKKLFMYRLFIPRLGTTGLAILLSIAIPLIISMYFFTKKRRYIFLFLIAFTALIFTFSRWNVIVAIISLLLFVFLVRSKISIRIRKKIIKKIIVTAFILGLLVAVLFDAEKLKYFLGYGDSFVDRTSSFYYRKTAFVEALSFFSKRPLVGYGPGEIYVRLSSQAKYRNESTGTNILSDYKSLSPYSITLEVPHSTFAMILAEGGILSFIAFVLLLSSLIKIQLKNLRSKESVYYQFIGIGLFVASFAFVFSMFFSNFDNIVVTSILFWFIQGIGLSFRKIKNRKGYRNMTISRHDLNSIQRNV